MKKFLSIIVILFSLLLASCGTVAPDSSSSQTSTPETSSPETSSPDISDILPEKPSGPDSSVVPDNPEKPHVDNPLLPPNPGDIWDDIQKPEEDKNWDDELKPNINITEIGGNNKQPLKSDFLSSEYGVYDFVYENIKYQLQANDFTVASAMAFDINDESKVAMGMMYYFDDLNLYADNNTYACGFVQILNQFENEVVFNEDANVAVVKMNAKDDKKQYIMSYNFNDLSFDHFIFKNKYVQYYQETPTSVRYIEKDNDKRNYDLTLGNLFNYDTNTIIYDESINDPYHMHSGIELFGKEDYKKLENDLEKLSKEQEEKGYRVSEFNLIYISPESIKAYLLNGEEDTFFGFKVDELVKEFGLGTALTYTENGFEEAQVITPQEDGYNWKSFLTKAGIGCGIILVGAILTPLTGGASFGCALVTISKVAVTFALSAACEELITNTVTGVIQGKTIKDSLKDGIFKGLDAFANGFMIGAAIGSIGVVSGLIKPTACFVAGTSILMANGLYKAIEDVNVGDMVMSFDEVTGKTSTNKVTHLKNKNVEETVNLTIDDEMIQTTYNHPFYSIDRNGWVKAGDLYNNEQVIGFNGDLNRVNQKSIIKHTTPVRVYNFTVENDHTYFVGEENTGVHNACDEVLTRREANNARNQAGKRAKKQAMDELEADKFKNIDDWANKWGFDLDSKHDREIVDFIQKNHRFPKKNIDGMECNFAHAIDKDAIRKACNNGLITKEQALEFISDPNNGLLTSRQTHYLLHNKNFHNATDYKKCIQLRQNIGPRVMEILKAITPVA